MDLEPIITASLPFDIHCKYLTIYFSMLSEDFFTGASGSSVYSR